MPKRGRRGLPSDAAVFKDNQDEWHYEEEETAELEVEEWEAQADGTFSKTEKAEQLTEDITELNLEPGQKKPKIVADDVHEEPDEEEAGEEELDEEEPEEDPVSDVPEPSAKRHKTAAEAADGNDDDDDL